MKRSIHSWLAALVVTWLAAPVLATVPGQVDFQGLLLDGAGQPVTGTVDLVFTLFDAPTAGTAVWTETLLSVPLVDGVYSVTLGATTPIASSVLATGDVHLEISVDGEVLTPRRALLAVPNAVRATDAENLGGESNLFYTEMIQHFAFDGGDPPNDDPSEGTGDVDGDGLANFVDSDNDDDGLSDTQELAQGSNINVQTPDIASVGVTPFTSGQTDFVVGGTQFVVGVTATFDGVPITLLNLTATSFDFTTPVIGSSGLRPLVVTRPNSEIASFDVQVDPLVPTISSVTPDPVLFGGSTLLSVVGTSFDPGMTVTFDAVPVTPVNITSTTFETTVTPPPMTALRDLVVTLPNSQLVVFPVQVRDSKRVFVTPTTTDGNLGGVAGADALCAAEAANLAISGTYLAWIGDATTDPATRFNQSAGPYERLDTVQIADDWADLTDGTLDNPIQFSPAVFVHSNVDDDGTLKSALDCNGWTSGSSSIQGWRGFSNQTFSGWTDWAQLDCDTQAVIYCFEQ